MRRVARFAVLGFTCVAVAMAARAVTPKAKAKPGSSDTAASQPVNPPTTTQPAAAAPDVGWYRFADHDAVPGYLKVDKEGLIDTTGLAGNGFTSRSDLIDHDFVFDVLIDPKEGPTERPFSRADVVVGIGQNNRNGNWVTDSVGLRLDHQDVTLIQTADGHGQKLTRIDDVPAKPAKNGKAPSNPPKVVKRGLTVVRLEKSGTALTLSVCFGYAGTFTPDLSSTIADLPAKAPYLTGASANLFFWRHTHEGHDNAVFLATRLTIDGKPADAGSASAPSAPVAAAPQLDDSTFFRFTPTGGLPGYLRANEKALVESGGIRGGELRTAAVDLVNHDFTFDLLFKYSGDDDRTHFLIGLGENGREGGWILNSVGAHLHGCGQDGGQVDLFQHHHYQHPPLVVGTVGHNAGPHVVRLQKAGNTLTVALCVNYQGEFKATYSKTWPDLQNLAPYLTATNAAVFVAAEDHNDQHATWLGVRFIVDGKLVPTSGGALAARRPAAVASNTNKAPPVPTPAPTPTPPAKPVKPSGKPAPPTPEPIVVDPSEVTGPQHLIALTGGPLPPFFQPQRELEYANDALTLVEGRSIRTAATDFINKDFTFDVVFRHSAKENRGLLVGIGENGRDGGWLLNSVALKLPSPRISGDVDLERHHEMGQKIGSVGRGAPAGPYLVRLRKKGNTLTLALCANYDGTYKPTIARTIPDLRSFAPYLTDKNSALFVADFGDVQKVRLIVEGEPIESRDFALRLPGAVIEGQPVRQALSAGPAGARKFRLQSGPAGAAVSPTGEIAWTPAADQVGPQTLRVLMDNAGETTVTSVATEVFSAADAKRAGGVDLAKLEALYRLPLAGEQHDIVNGADGRSLLLLEGDSLKRLDAGGLGVRETQHLPKRYSMLRERDGYYLAISPEAKTLDVLDKVSLKVVRAIAMDYREITDVALHPRRATCYVAVSSPGGDDGPHYKVLEVDERTGDVREHEDFIGRWVTISPDGTRAYTGYKDIYEKGMRLLTNPGRWDLVPDYGDINLLIVYDISGADPREVAVKRDAGGNGFGIAMSPDGRRLSYLSYVGYPLFSGNVPAWDPSDFTKRPVGYPTKANAAKPTKIAFHPVLPIAAAPSDAGAVAFDREVGSVQPDRLDLRHPLEFGAHAVDVCFAPGGRDLLIVCEQDKTNFYLRRIPLRLSAAEEAALKAPRVVPPAQQIGSPNPRADVRD